MAELGKTWRRAELRSYQKNMGEGGAELSPEKDAGRLRGVVML
jgi:hypothetical protein